MDLVENSIDRDDLDEITSDHEDIKELFHNGTVAGLKELT